MGTGGKCAGGCDAGRYRRRAGVSRVIVNVGDGRSVMGLDASTLLGFGLLRSLKNPFGVSDPDEGLNDSVLMLDGLVFSGVTNRAGASFLRGESEVRLRAFVGVIMENPLPKMLDVSFTTESLLELLLAGLLGVSASLAFFGSLGTSTSPSRSWLLLRIPGASSFMADLLLSAAGLPENQDVLR